MDTTTSSNEGISQLWKDAWRLDPDELRKAKVLLQGKNWTTAEIVKAYLEEKKQQIAQQAAEATATPTLIELTIDAIVKELDQSSNIEEQIRSISGSLEWPLLRRLLLSGRIPYPHLHKFVELCPYEQTGVDIDLAILQQTRYVACKNHSSIDVSRLFLHEHELHSSLRPHLDLPGKGTRAEEDCLRYKRPDPPDGSFNIFDKDVDRFPAFYGTCRGFDTHFEHFTSGTFRHLDWSNIVIVGRTLLFALCNPTYSVPAEDDDGRGFDGMAFEMRLYDMTPTEANRKLEHIFATLQQDQETNPRLWPCIEKTLETTSISTEYAMLKIEHRIFDSIYDAIGQYPLDAGALGYNGYELLFTSRCARSLETGYSCFTPNVPFSRRLLHSRIKPTKVQILEFADIGFGLRLPPAYVKVLSEKSLEPFGKASDLHDEASECATSASYIPNMATLIKVHKLWRFDDLRGSPWNLPQYDLSEDLFRFILQPFIRQRLNRATTQRTDFADYLTRRIRHRVAENELESARQKQIVLPLTISAELEAYLTALWDSELTTSSGVHHAFSSVIIPVCKRTRQGLQPSSLLPPLADSADESVGNLRYWVVSNQARWSGMGLRDYVSMVLQSISEYFLDLAANPPNTAESLDASCFALKWRLLMDLRMDASAHKAREVRPSPHGIDRDDLALLTAWALGDLNCEEPILA